MSDASDAGSPSPGDEARRTAEEWLARHEAPEAVPDHGGELLRLAQQAAQTRALLTRLSTLFPSGQDIVEAERLRRRLLDELERLGSQVGGLVFDWLARGGTLELVPAAAPSVAAATAEAPAEVATPSHEDTGPRLVDDPDGRSAVPATPMGPDPAPPALAVPEVAPPPPPQALSAPAPPPALLRTVDLTALRRDVGPAWSRTTTLPAAVDSRVEEWDRDQLGEFLERFGPPAPVVSGKEAIEVDRLVAEIDDDTFATWRRFPSRIQRLLVALAVGRARYLQERCQSGSDAMRLNTTFSLLTRYSAAEQPGYVNGLSRGHVPKNATWLDDARVAWSALRDELPEDEPDERPNPQVALNALRALLATPAPADDAVVAAIAQVLESGIAPEDGRLIDLLAPRAEALQGPLGRLARFKRIRRALREREDSRGEDDEDESGADTPLPPDWPLWSSTRGHRAVLIGGDLREEARARIERSLQLASLEWVTTDKIRGAQQLAQSIRAGGVDVVILLRRFIGHEIERIVSDACDAVGIACVGVDRGYGVTQVRLAFEKALARKAG